MTNSIPALERAQEFVATNNIDFLLAPAYFQGHVMLVQSLMALALVYISIKVSKL